MQLENQDVVIEADSIVKKFKIYPDKGHTIKEKVISKKRRQYDVNEVLKGISFQIKKGETVGLIGKNGCGKSTTLKLLSRIMYPDSGTVKVRGRVSSLIELGAGFHPDMTGRQNIYINASIFGLSKKEIENRLDTIIEFSELQEYIDNPVRTYSSGMYTRLAFSVAINVDANILLIDEILAVGDVNFQTKCFEKLREIKKSGVTIVLVTHDSGTVDWFCDRAIWINRGYIEKDGKASEVVDAYMHCMSEEKVTYLENRNEKKSKENEDTNENCEEEVLQVFEDSNRIGTRQAEIINVVFKDESGNTITVARNGQPLIIQIDYDVKEINNYVFGIGIFTIEGVRIFGTNTQLDRYEHKVAIGKGKVSIYFSDFAVLEGLYMLQVAITDMDGTLIDFHRDYMHFNVVSRAAEVGIVSMKHKWS